MNKNHYFINAVGQPITGVVQYHAMPESDPRSIQVDGVNVAVAGVAHGGGWDITYPEQVYEVDGTDYSEADYIAAFTVKAEVDGVEDDYLAPVATIVKPKRTKAGAFAAGYLKANYWQGAAGWPLKKGVQEVTLKEYMAAVASASRSKK